MICSRQVHSFPVLFCDAIFEKIALGDLSPAGHRNPPLKTVHRARPSLNLINFIPLFNPANRGRLHPGPSFLQKL